MVSAIRLAIILLALTACTYVASARSGELVTENFRITYQDISNQQAREFATQAEKALSDVTSYLGRTWEAPSYTSVRKIRIDIADTHAIPRANTSEGRIIIPANRIRGDAGGPPRIRGRGPAIVHEITHVVAASRNQPNRYLDEGLGVYMQEKFGVDRSYPNMGEDVHEMTGRLLKDYGKIISLRDWEHVRLKRRAGIGRSVAYLQEGSFVRYLIETYGLDKFMRVFDGDAYMAVYDKSVQALETEWHAFIKPYIK